MKKSVSNFGPGAVPRRGVLVPAVMLWLIGAAVFLALCVVGTFSYFWIHYGKIVDQKLKEGPFTETAMLFAAPEYITVGDVTRPAELVLALKRRGYTESRSNRMGWYNVRAEGVEIFPGVDSFGQVDPGVVFINAKGVVTRIVSNRDNTERQQYMLEPELVTNLFDRQRGKRRMVRYSDIPPILVQAVLSAEDKRFFQHSGFDPIRIVRTAWVDVTQNKRYGASTISMQLARGFWLTQDKTWQRKAAEILITLQIEQKLSKEQIFEYYANHVDLGQRRSFAIHGFGEASQVYFGKDIRELKPEEAAMLAGLIQRPNYLNPYRHPERAEQRRNVILGLMKDNGYLTELQYLEAVKTPIKLADGGVESTDAPYFVDLVADELQERFADLDFQSRSYKVYTTLDRRLQQDAVQAIQIGLKEVDALLAKQKRKNLPEAQVALVAIDPLTAEVKALVGGRNYGTSQLNRALAKRQPGSVFKPFVYAALLNEALLGAVQATPVTRVMDEPTTFWYDGKPYEPNNFHQQFRGNISMRDALAHSMNIPTVKFAEMAGYGNVAELAKNAGMKGVRATPAMALGSYEVTPLDMAGAYTVFSNGGIWVEPNMVREVRSETGGAMYARQAVKREVLDPRVAYMTVSLMQEVLRSGTGAGARSRGFVLPAAGKTGTSHDAWFAGFTTKLLTVVWVGFDDNQELPLEGAKAALPIWTEFMKRAHLYREYRGVQEFAAPDGIVTADICVSSGYLAGSTCPKKRPEVFLAGTQPSELCPEHGGGRTMVAAWDEASPVAPPPLQEPPAPGRPRPKATTSVADTQVNPAPAPAQPAAQKKGIWGRIRSIFR